jgi:hypothetical protein
LKVENRKQNALAVVLLLTACSTDTALQPFTSDGCSLFPDSSLISESNWCSCCFEHDTQYWRGGTRDERSAADRKFRDRVLEKTANAALADVMYQGVNLGGSPYFHTWYRWGYGWPSERKYQVLTPDEDATARRLLGEYFANNQTSACPL